MLPDIVEVAEKHNLEINPRSMGRKEVTCKCPFCGEDSNKRGKYYLSLNMQYKVFKCWFCKESGGVFRFISLLENKPEHEVKQEHRKINGSGGYQLHPVEKLTLHQLQFIGYEKIPRWAELRKRDKDYYLRTRDLIHSEWKEFIETEKYSAFQILLTGIHTLTYDQSIQLIKKREKETGVDILKDVLKVYSQSKRPNWAQKAESFVNMVLNQNKILN